MIIFSSILYFFRILVLGIAAGVFSIKHALFSKMREEYVLLVGVGATPMLISFADYVMGFIFIGLSCWIYLLIPLGISLFYLFYEHNYRIACHAIMGIKTYFNNIYRRMGIWFWASILGGLTFVVFLVVLFSSDFDIFMSLAHSMLSVSGIGLFILVLFVFSMVAFLISVIRKNCLNLGGDVLTIASFITVVGASLFLFLSFVGMPTIDKDRSHYEIEARYFAEDMNSLEIDNYLDERNGSSLRDDHGPLWVLNLADGKMIAKSLGLNEDLGTTNIAIFWTYFCFLLLLFVASSYIAQTPIAGTISLELFGLYYHEVMLIWGSRDAFRFVGLLLLLLYSISILEKINNSVDRLLDYVVLMFVCYFSMNGHEGNAYIMLGLFVVFGIILLFRKTAIKKILLCVGSVFVGTMFGIAKSVSLYIQTGELVSSTLLPFHDTPVVEQINCVNQIRGDWSTIWATYSIYVKGMMAVGVLGLVVMLVYSAKKRDHYLLVATLMLIGMLLPMTRIMDWTGYECARWFLEQYRYRMYFLMLLAISGAWVVVKTRKMEKVCGAFYIILIGLLFTYFRVERSKYGYYDIKFLEENKAKVQGYVDVAEEIELLTQKDVFTSDQVVLYYLSGNPKLLFTSYSEELIQAKTDDEIEEALDHLNVGIILLPEDGLDYHDYSLLPFWRYINCEDNFMKIVSDVENRDYGTKMVIYCRKEAAR